MINNDGCVHVAPWGELATLSCIQRGIAGVVIDGAARDIDDIRAMKFPLFARAVVPNAGEPKGFGEINAEIQCCGQYIRPGDWIVGDESGVVVIPASGPMKLPEEHSRSKKPRQGSARRSAGAARSQRWPN